MDDRAEESDRFPSATWHVGYIGDICVSTQVCGFFSYISRATEQVIVHELSLKKKKLGGHKISYFLKTHLFDVL